MPFRDETIEGIFDGVLTTVQTQYDYVPGSVRVFLPLLNAQTEATELGGKDVQLAVAPLEGDTIMVVYSRITT